ncbi:bicaudal C homolog 2 isoform X2 [Hippocampus zosterae]|uniref:bicaudal C homolog 2 isoform X2 n=1 Tax=Hippocampus zosterae TaxID=109293 RepID=UPI00223D5E3B|nr:bicaudal C homolog 2 isoform X2 [Hippocampus zosterae]
MTNTTSPEESSPAQGAVAPSEPDLETNVEPDSAAKPEHSEACCEREDEEEGEQTAPGQENAQGQSVEPEWVEERFRINRKKLETMLYAPRVGDAMTGEEFFERVMKETDTQVKWPSKLKIGAKSKKDPHVKVEGKKANVLQAKKKILEVLETRVNKVTLKMDVAYTEHSHVIGKGGGNIKKVVQTLGVSVSFRAVPPQPQAQPAFFGSCCTVWGLQGNTPAVKKATCVLMELLVGSEVTGSVVTSQLDVTSQQHLFLLGQNGAHFLSVMHHTQTQIILPDLSAPQNLPSLVIQGSPDGVCLARQQLMDCLPVCLMFDMREDVEADPCALAQMMQNLGVFISVKPKVKQTNKSVVVKGLERNIQCLYEARRLLLGLDSYDSTKVTNVDPDPILAGNELTSYWLNMLLQQLRLSEHGPVPAPITEVQCGTKARPSPPPGLSSPTDEVRAGLKGTESRPLEKILENDDQSGQSDDESSKDMVMMTSSEDAINIPTGTRVTMMGRRGSLQGPEMSKVFSQARRHSTGQAFTCRMLNADMERGRMERRNSLRRDVMLSRDVCADVLQSEVYDYEKKKLLATRAMQRKPVVTEVRTPTDTWSGLGFSKSMPAEALKELRNISRRSYRPYLSTSSGQSWANQSGAASHGSNSDNWRDRRGSQPASSSSSSSAASPSSPPPASYSSSSHIPTFASNRNRNDKPTEGFPGCNYFDDMCPSRRASTCSQRSPSPQLMDDLPELLSQLGLMKYIDVLEQQEVDYQTFLTLSDDDLKEVGVSTFGARRKMLLAISELNKSKRRPSDTSSVKSGYLEGGASGRLPRIADMEVAALSDRW